MIPSSKLIPPQLHHDAAIPRYWAFGNPVITAFYNALSIVIPDGEQFFIGTIERHIHRITDTSLQTAAHLFISQEQQHSASHNHFNELLHAQGFNTHKYNRLINRYFYQPIQRFGSHKFQLATTVALEHLSATLTEQFLTHKNIRKGLFAPIKEQYIHHSIEENEHKSVSFDVYSAVYNDYFTRILAYALVLSCFTPQVLFIQCALIWHDRQTSNIKAWCQGTSYFLLKPAWLIRSIPNGLRFLLPSFHPKRSQDASLLKKWHTIQQGKLTHSPQSSIQPEGKV